MPDRIDLNRYGVMLASVAAARSEDPYMKAGAVLIRADKTVAATGYNGAPSGIELDWKDRDHRRDRVIHAEANALRYVVPGEAVMAATTHLPCVECVKAMASYGITRVVWRSELPDHYDSLKIFAVAADLRVDLRKLEES